MRTPRLAATFTALLLIMLSGCGWGTPPPMRTVDFTADEVTEIEVYLYDFLSESELVELAVVTDADDIAVFVDFVTDMTLKNPDQDQVAKQVPGQPAAGMRFMLADGSTFEVTQVRGQDDEVIIFWQDESAWAKDGGIDYYSLIGITDWVDAQQRPVADLF